MTRNRIDVHQHIVPTHPALDASPHAAIDRRSAEALFPAFAASTPTEVP